MASGFFAILDDIAALMDDIAVTSKIATKQTAGILGDDLAVNAEKATGFLSSREIPVLLSIMKGSFVNKLIIVPLIFFLQWLYPPAISIILVLGGIYLAYEGVEKIIEFFFPHAEDLETGTEVREQIEAPGDEGEREEKAKIKSAIQTDFILSLEIVIIALSTVLHEPMLNQILTVAIVSVIATMGVYGIVAMIVRMDDLGFRLQRKSGNKGLVGKIGQLLVQALPWVIKGLGVVGTIALILVAGGIFDHNIDYVHHILTTWPSTLKHAVLGLAGGLAAFPIFWLIKKVMPKKKNAL